MRSSDKVRVRIALPSDLDTVAEVWRQSALVMDGLPREVPSLSDLRRRIDTELRSGWELRVATLNCHIVGLLATKPADAVLDQIFVLPLEQGNGIGSALLEAAKQTLPLGFTLRMDARNELARRFYVKHGLTLVREGVHPATGIAVHFYSWNVG